MRSKLIALACVATLATAGCSVPSWRVTRDPVSAGTAKLFLKMGETTQGEVLEVFGGPNIVTGDAERNETWTYDRMNYASSSTAGGALGGGAGVIGSTPVGGLLWGRTSRSSSSSRSVTLFLYWTDGLLTNYKYRSASF